jgi:hypothetical protein
VEIEGPDDRAVLALRDKLGLGAVPLIHASYIAMLRSYLSERGLAHTQVRFDTDPAACPGA